MQKLARGFYVVLGAAVTLYSFSGYRSLAWGGSNKPLELIRSKFQKGELLQLCQAAIQTAQNKMDAIAAVAEKDRGFDNTVLAFEGANADLNDAAVPLSFMKYVSPDDDTNSEGAKCEQLQGEFMVKTFGRRDIYNAIRGQKPRNADETRLFQKMTESYEVNGLKLSDDNLEKVTALFSKLNDLQAEYSDNLNNDDTKVEYTADELAGMSQDVLSRLKKTDQGNYIVTTKITDYNALMENATKEETRKKMAVAYNNRQGEKNTKLLEDAIQVRQQIAKAMGFATWADFQLSHGRMAKDSKSVLDFLNGLKDKLAERNHQDIQQLLDFKKTLDPKATEVNAWDLGYLAYQLQKRDFSLDDEVIREYFPSDEVVKGMFQVYSQLLGVNYEQVKDAGTWSDDVKMYRITDQKDNHTIGYFYTDFIPRQGKYEHFAAFPIISARQLANGYSYPVSAIVGNFNPPAGGKPSLLNHDEVVTVFHEFGHIMHQTLTKAPYASLSGSAVDQDFVEAPSQMLENWPWQEKILNLLGGHYLDSTKKLPPELLKKMLEVRDYQQGYYYTRQLMLALLDMTYHTAIGAVDTAAIYDQLYGSLLGVKPVPGEHFAASFGHLMGGYDAGYYGYLWSLVSAADMFTVFQNTDVLDSKTGDLYRRTILERGNMEDPQDLLTRFLGRPSNNEAFLRMLHIGNN